MRHDEPRQDDPLRQDGVRQEGMRQDGMRPDAAVGVPAPDPTAGPTARPEPVPDPVPDPTTDPMPTLSPEPDSEPELVVEPEPAAVPADDDAGAALFGAGDVDRFRARWRELQADFVDDPAQAVRGADDLVGEVMRALSEVVAEHKRALEGGWRDGAGETEDLRVALRRYRAFFDQLLTT